MISENVSGICTGGPLAVHYSANSEQCSLELIQKRLLFQMAFVHVQQVYLASTLAVYDADDTNCVCVWNLSSSASLALSRMRPLLAQTPKCAFEEAFMKSQLLKWYGVCMSISVFLACSLDAHLPSPAHRDMTKGSQYCVFRYTKYYHKMAGAELVLDLLNDPDVQDVLQVRIGATMGGKEGDTYTTWQLFTAAGLTGPTGFVSGKQQIGE
jgi:hypothetical protein